MTKTRTTLTALAPLAAAAVLAAPAAAAPKAPTFKASVYIYQSAEWSASWTTPELCGDDYRHTFAGDGQGTAVFKTASARVTFTRLGRGAWTSSWFRMSGQIGRQAGYETGESGNPDGCLPDYVGKPEEPDTSECGLKKVSRSAKSFNLSVIRGRLVPGGAFAGAGGGDPFDGACPDQTTRTGVVWSVPSPQRQDVDKLIANKNVRSIELTSGRSYVRETLGADELFFPGGENQAGEGEFEGRWKVKLTRVR